MRVTLTGHAVRALRDRAQIETGHERLICGEVAGAVHVVLSTLVRVALMML